LVELLKLVSSSTVLLPSPQRPLSQLSKLATIFPKTSKRILNRKHQLSPKIIIIPKRSFRAVNCINLSNTSMLLSMASADGVMPSSLMGILEDGGNSDDDIW